MNDKSEFTTEQKERLVAFLDVLMEPDFDNEKSNCKTAIGFRRGRETRHE